MPSTYVGLFFLVSHLILLTCSAKEPKGHLCPSSFQCGTLGTFSYPFTTAFNPDCGICVINCTDTIPTIGLSSSGPWYKIMNNFSSKRSFVVSDEDFLYITASNACNHFERKTITLPKSSTLIFTNLSNETFWKCRKAFNISRSRNFRRILDCRDYNIYHSNNSEDGIRFSDCMSFLYPQKLLVELSNKCSQCIGEGGRCEKLMNGESQCINKQQGVGKWWSGKGGGGSGGGDETEWCTGGGDGEKG
uniref:Uncharacterized protein n=1 Tax=Chenopodium quinoa TaxID=63459 RepID=A0A803KUX4_CHEQI